MPASSGRSPLFERDLELKALTEVVTAVASGEPRILAIEGPGGIGKTRLLSEAQSQAESAGVQVLFARGSERERRLPFGVVDQLLASEPDVASDQLGAALALPGEGDDDVSFGAMRQLVRVVADLAAEHPVVLVVDDLHLADEPSLQFLGYVARRLGQLRVSIACTLRPFERSASAVLLADLVGDPRATSIRPAALSDAATSQLLGTELGQRADDAFASACREATGGNPLLLSELAESLRRERVEPRASDVAALNELGPRAVLRTVLLRLSGLPAEARELARAIAVLGDAADLHHAAELAAINGSAVSGAASLLIANEILVDGPGSTFVHPLVGAAVYEDIPAPERAAAHGRAAVFLRRRSRPAAVIAAHVALADPAGEDWVCEVLAEAARASLRAGAPADAVAYLLRAMDEPPPPQDRPALALALGSAMTLVDGPAAEGYLREALRVAAGPAAQALAALELARLLMFLGRVGESVPIIREATAALGPDADDLLRMLATAELMAPFYDPSQLPAADVLALGRQLPLGPGLGSRMLAAITGRHWAYDGGTADACAELALAALDGGDLVRADDVFLSVTAVMVLELADRCEADACWDVLLRAGEVHGSRASKLSVSLFRGYGLTLRGELVAAEASLIEGYAALTDWNIDPATQPHAAAFLSAVLRERGDLPGAAEALARVAVPEDASDGARLWLDSHIQLLLASGEADAALAAAQEAELRFAHLRSALDTSPRLRQAEALHQLGRAEEARAAAVAALADARRWGAPGTVARALRVAGVIDGAAGTEQLRQAVELARGTPARLELAKAQLELGVALRGSGQSAEARIALREGLELAALLGAVSLEARARRELHAAGGRPRTTALTGPTALTAAERRVVERAIAGDTNRVIAETLFVTAKTVELHLSNAYRKLGVAGRRGLAAALAEDASLNAG